MTKKDYIIIARVFNTTTQIWTDARAKWQEKYDTRDKTDGGGGYTNKIDGINKILASMDVIVKGLCHELRKDNPKFNAEMFAKACGLLSKESRNATYQGSQREADDEAFDNAMAA